MRANTNKRRNENERMTNEWQHPKYSPDREHLGKVKADGSECRSGRVFAQDAAAQVESDADRSEGERHDSWCTQQQDAQDASRHVVDGGNGRISECTSA